MGALEINYMHPSGWEAVIHERIDNWKSVAYSCFRLLPSPLPHLLHDSSTRMGQSVKTRSFIGGEG